VLGGHNGFGLARRRNNNESLVRVTVIARGAIAIAAGERTHLRLDERRHGQVLGHNSFGQLGTGNNSSYTC
jgi:hypothetical protein